MRSVQVVLPASMCAAIPILRVLSIAYSRAISFLYLPPVSARSNENYLDALSQYEQQAEDVAIWGAPVFVVHSPLDDTPTTDSGQTLCWRRPYGGHLHAFSRTHRFHWRRPTILRSI